MIRPIIDIVTVAGAALVLSACSGQQTFDTAVSALNGGTPLLGSDAAEASLVEVALPVVEAPAPVVEPEPEPLPPAKVWTCYPFRGTTFCDWL